MQHVDIKYFTHRPGPNYSLVHEEGSVSVPEPIAAGVVELLYRNVYTSVHEDSLDRFPLES